MYEDFREIKRLESPEDWRKWREDIKYSCMLVGWESLFTKYKNKPDSADTIPDGSDSDNELITRKSWRQQQAIACGHIESTLGYYARQLVKDTNTVSEMVDALEKKYSYRYLLPTYKTTYLMNLLSELNRISFADYNNEISKFTNRLYEIREDMKLLDESCALMEPFWINKLLDSLPSDYREVLIGFRSTCNYFPERDQNGVITKKAVTFEDAVLVALRAEQIVKTSRTEEREHCGRTGHLRKSCWELHPHKRPAKRRRK